MGREFNREPGARRKATNVSLRSDVVEQARALGINLSATAERALIEAVREAQAREWLRRNAEAIEAYNERIDRDGMYNADLRLI